MIFLAVMTDLKRYEQFDYLHTFLQFLKRFPTNIRPKNLVAQKTISSLAALSIDNLALNGIKGIIWDVDGTLVGYHGKSLDETAREKLEQSIAAGLQNVILSNSGEERFNELGRIFAGYDVKVACGYQRKKNAIGPLYVTRVIYHGEDTCFYEDIGRRKQLVSFDPLNYKKLKKPNPDLIDIAVREMSNDYSTSHQMPAIPSYQIAMVGDKAFTDISGGNQAGCFTVQIKPPMQPKKDPILARVGRALEYGILAVYRAVGLVKKK